MRQGPKHNGSTIMQCSKCSLVMTADERIDLVNTAYDLGVKHCFEGSPSDATGAYGPFFRGEYLRGYTHRKRSFDRDA